MNADMKKGRVFLSFLELPDSEVRLGGTCCPIN